MLNHADVAWQRDDAADPRKFAHSKLPVLRANGRVIHDSDNIRLFLEENGTDFWGDTSARDKAMGRALIRMAEDHLYFHVTNKIRNEVRQGLHSQGIGRMTEAECLIRLDQDLDAIRGLLTDSAFLMGAKPTLPDFSVASVLTNIAASPIPTPTSLRVKDDPALMGYVTRMKEMYD